MIQYDNVYHKGKICKNKWREEEKTTFSYRIFGISTYGFTQILSLGTHWMCNLIPNLTNNPNEYFWGTHATQKWKFQLKMYFNIKICFLLKFSFLGVVGTSEVCSVGMGWMQNLILHPLSHQTQNLGEPKSRYAKNTIRKK